MFGLEGGKLGLESSELGRGRCAIGRVRGLLGRESVGETFAFVLGELKLLREGFEFVLHEFRVSIIQGSEKEGVKKYPCGRFGGANFAELGFQGLILLPGLLEVCTERGDFL